MNMRTSDAGIFALALHEGIVPAPYKDSVGVWTYGIGHTAGAGAPDPAMMPRGMPKNLDAALADVFATFRRDLPKYEAGVNRAVKVPISQAQFDALVSFHYNTGAIGKASLVKRLNAGDKAGAAAGFMAWKKPAEIIPRRKEEQKLFATGTYPSGQVTVWQVDGSGRVIWKPVKRLNMPQDLDLLRGKTETVALEPAAQPIIEGKRTDIPARPTQRGPSGPVALILMAVAGAAYAFWERLLSWFN
jgi:lysozyme